MSGGRRRLISIFVVLLSKVVNLSFVGLLLLFLLASLVYNRAFISEDHPLLARPTLGVLH